MRVLTILGTRPEIIRLACVIPKLDGLCDHVLAHTGQNFEPELSDLFFKELDLRQPDRHLGIRGTGFGEQLGQLLERVDRLISEVHPDRLLILGDTNSGLSAIVAKRRGVPVLHMEAGNRCFDDRVPEEVNRRVIDHCSDVHMPYSERSRTNLLREGIPPERVYVIGNPIGEVLERYQAAIVAAEIGRTLGVEPGSYFLATLHRAENVDESGRLQSLIESLEAVCESHCLPLIVSTHPRLRDRLDRGGIRVANPGVRLVSPLGFLSFAWLERNARCVLTDSGTVQEECCILRVPNVTLRDVTERPETIERGSNILAGASPGDVQRAVETALHSSRLWDPPPEYVVPQVSDTVVKIVLGYLPGRVDGI